jgi:capsid protein
MCPKQNVSDLNNIYVCKKTHLKKITKIGGLRSFSNFSASLTRLNHTWIKMDVYN